MTVDIENCRMSSKCIKSRIEIERKCHSLGSSAVVNINEVCGRFLGGTFDSHLITFDATSDNFEHQRSFQILCAETFSSKVENRQQWLFDMSKRPTLSIILDTPQELFQRLDAHLTVLEALTTYQM